MLCSFMDSLYFYGLLALGGLCAHLYEHPPTNSTLSPIWAPTVRRTPPPPMQWCGGRKIKIEYPGSDTLCVTFLIQSNELTLTL